jgi:hypothetical protein
MTLDDYTEVWLADFTFDRPPGERPTPTRLAARELRSGATVVCEGGPSPPYPVGPDALFVAYGAPAALGCHLALGWPLPASVLDLHAEFRRSVAGLEPVSGHAIEDALAHLGLAGAGPGALERLLGALLPTLDLRRAVEVRGRYAAAVARMEHVGVPLDVDLLGWLRAGWDRIKEELVRRVDQAFGVYVGGRLDPRRWQEWVNRRGIPWPRKAPGHLDRSVEAFRDMALAHPEVRPVHQLQATLSRLRPFGLAVGKDGRNRCPLRPYASKTGRNQPSTSGFVFGPATWVRSLIRPEEGMALAYVDFEQQEFGIAAALSGDRAMQEAYQSGDPYLRFAVQAGAAPEGATKQTHGEVREQFKRCALGVQYGMTAKGLAASLAVSPREAQELIKRHKQTYREYWAWSDAVLRQAKKVGRIETALGWAMWVAKGTKSRTVRNFPLQANGAEMLRLVCIDLTEAGVQVCAPVHDALLVEAPAERIGEAVRRCQEAMARASAAVLGGFALRTDAKVIPYPDRFEDPRGRAMWKKVSELIGQPHEDLIAPAPQTSPIFCGQVVEAGDVRVGCHALALVGGGRREQPVDSVDTCLGTKT